MGVSSKYATHFLNAYSEEYSMILMMISGFIGSWSGVILFIGEIEIEGHTKILSFIESVFKIEPIQHSSLGISTP